MDNISRTEQKLQVNLRSLIKSSIWITLSQVVATLSTLALAIVMAKYLSKESYGIYRYIISISTIIGSFTLSGASTAIIQSVSRGFEGELKKWVNILFKWSVIPWGASILTSFYYLINQNYAVSIGVLLVGILYPILSSTLLYSAFLSGKHDFKRMSTFSFIQNILPSIAGILFIPITKNPVILVSIFILTQTLVSIYFYFITTKKFSTNNLVDKTTKSLSIEISIMNTLGIVADQIDKILTFHLFGAAPLAVYALASAIPEQIKGVMKGVETLALPRFAKGDLHAIRKTLLYKMSILGIFVLATIALYIVIAPFLYKLIFPNYLQSIYYSQIYSLSLIVGLAYLPTSILQSKIDALKELRYFGVSSSIFQIISVIFGAYLGGVIGIIFARIITRLFNLIVSTILTFKIKIKES